MYVWRCNASWLCQAFHQQFCNNKERGAGGNRCVHPQLQKPLITRVYHCNDPSVCLRIWRWLQQEVVERLTVDGCCVICQSLHIGHEPQSHYWSGQRNRFVLLSISLPLITARVYACVCVCACASVPDRESVRVREKGRYCRRVSPLQFTLFVVLRSGFVMFTLYFLTVWNRTEASSSINPGSWAKPNNWPETRGWTFVSSAELHKINAFKINKYLHQW